MVSDIPVICGSLTVASTHSSIMVGYSNEIIETGSSVGVDQKLRHVQISGERERERERKTCMCHIYTSEMRP